MLPVTVQPETVHFYPFTKKKDFDTKFLGQAMRELYDHWVGELALHQGKGLKNDDSTYESLKMVFMQLGTGVCLQILSDYLRDKLIIAYIVFVDERIFDQ